MFSILSRDISIPNTFIRVPYSNSLLITDSLKKKIFKFDFDSSWKKVIHKKEWLNFKDSDKIPDGDMRPVEPYAEEKWGLLYHDRLGTLRYD